MQSKVLYSSSSVAPEAFTFYEDKYLVTLFFSRLTTSVLISD